MKSADRYFWQPHMVTILGFTLAAASVVAEVPITVVESGNGLEHNIQIEAAGRFRLFFEAEKNYGITRWYDLAGDPAA
ncbi:MAG: hypothetical protein QGG01_00910, partial [Roseibacillus sp.]|nr:hypothetical protein [Roseibacillus sp.]